MGSNDAFGDDRIIKPFSFIIIIIIIDFDVKWWLPTIAIAANGPKDFCSKHHRHHNLKYQIHKMKCCFICNYVINDGHKFGAAHAQIFCLHCSKFAPMIDDD